MAKGSAGTTGLERDSFRMRTDMKLMAILDGVCLNGDCDPVIGKICIWDYTVCETRAKLFEE